MDRRMDGELLDELDPENPCARGSRRDLRRLNAWMSSARTIASALNRVCTVSRPTFVLELGAGDGTVLLEVARKLRWRGVRAVLVDKQYVPRETTLEAFRELGWVVESVRADVIDWLTDTPSWDEPIATVCNLFLHHLTEAQLVDLFVIASRKTDVFVASEPRRSGVALFFSRMVGLIGCNDVTRHDAPASVRAGFTKCELSRLWPQRDEWFTDERPKGLFSHLFVASRPRR